jgi:hypothetical protein
MKLTLFLLFVLAAANAAFPDLPIGINATAAAASGFLLAIILGEPNG